MTQTVFAGVDVGHSAVKITLDTPQGLERIMFPSHVAPAIRIDDEIEAARARKETVSVNDKSFFVGETARIQGGGVTNSGLLDDWIKMDQHVALVTQACRMVTEAAQGKHIHLVSGLPVGLFSTQKITLKRQFMEALPNGSTVTIIPQPLAGFYHAILQRDGTLNPQCDILNETYAVIDIGFYTTDFVLLREGRWVQAGAASAPGVRLAANLFADAMKAQGIDCGLHEAEQALATGLFKGARHPEQQAIVAAGIEHAFDALADKVYDEFARLVGQQARIIDHIIVIGGAVDRIFPRLRAGFEAAVVPVDDYVQPATPFLDRFVTGRRYPCSGPRFIVSEGYYRLARNNEAMT